MKSKKKNELDVYSLREIYRKQCVTMRKWDFHTCEDLAQEMICIAIETNKRKGIKIHNCSTKWMLSDALSRVFGKYRAIGNFEYNEHDPNLPVMSVDDMEKWFCFNWNIFTSANNGNGKIRARYKCSANGASIVYDSAALCSLLRGKDVTYDRAALSNFLKRGATFYLLDGNLIRSSHPVKKAVRIRLEFVERIAK